MDNPNRTRVDILRDRTSPGQANAANMLRYFANYLDDSDAMWLLRIAAIAEVNIHLRSTPDIDALVVNRKHNSPSKTTLLREIAKTIVPPSKQAVWLSIATVAQIIAIEENGWK